LGVLLRCRTGGAPTFCARTASSVDPLELRRVPCTAEPGAGPATAGTAYRNSGLRAPLSGPAKRSALSSGSVCLGGGRAHRHAVAFPPGPWIDAPARRGTPQPAPSGGPAAEVSLQQYPALVHAR